MRSHYVADDTRGIGIGDSSLEPAPNLYGHVHVAAVTGFQQDQHAVVPAAAYPPLVGKRKCELGDIVVVKVGDSHHADLIRSALVEIDKGPFEGVRLIISKCVREIVHKPGRILRPGDIITDRRPARNCQGDEQK